MTERDNFNLAGYLRKNTLLNEAFEGFGGYKDLSPLKEDEKEDLGGWDGDGEHDQYDGEYDGETGPAITNELEKPEKIYADDEEDSEQGQFDRTWDMFGGPIQKVVMDMINDGYEPEDAAQFLRDFADQMEQGNIF